MTTSTSTPVESAPLSMTAVRSAVDDACGRIAPTWPLDRFIAVNPFWGMIDKPVPDVAARLRALSGARLLMPRAWFREKHAAGELQDVHLREAIARAGSPVTLAQLLTRLQQPDPEVPKRAQLVDIADTERDLIHEVAFADFVTNSMSQFCAAYFDEGQASFGPDRDGGLYASWRQNARIDKGPKLLMGVRGFRVAALDLPEDAREMIGLALADLEIPEDERVTYLEGLLLDVVGWSSWCMYRRWTARLAGADDDAIVDLLAVRIAWEWLLHRAGGEHVPSRWRLAMASWAKIDTEACASQELDWLFQDAMEIAWEQRVSIGLPAGLGAAAPRGVAAQVAFCIDVRSEVFRRALEAQTPEVQTLGFAGFFGMPIEYQPLGSPEARPQLPGLLAPALRVTDTGLAADAAAQRHARLGARGAWQSLKTGALSTFPFVEAMGISYIGKLLAASLGRGAGAPGDDTGLDAGSAARRKPRLTSTASGEELDLAQRCDLAANILRAMSLTRNFARLVVLVGHGSETRNNPHAAGLDCGACCGQSGEVNARATAAMLNDPDVRTGLAERGIQAPASTRFLAGLHNTTTDEVTLFDLDEVPQTHAADVTDLQLWLAGAGTQARAERAPALGLAGLPAAELQDAVRERARDWAQVRPEWGLANNASFIVAPREHTRHLDLNGRSFLHDYRHQEDEGYAVLELIMTAPMVVTHWINMQYYASTVDNQRYGSGNKVLHNVVGGHVGVFEGNGGDLRTGLSMQSLHDGSRWLHTPLRLSVFLEAPRPAIEDVLARHEHVRALVDNGWIHLFQIDADEKAVHALRDGRWERQNGQEGEGA